MTRALTLYEFRREVKAKRLARIEISLSQRLVYEVQFCLIAFGMLAMIEVAHTIVLHSFSKPLFSAILELVDTILGALLT